MIDINLTGTFNVAREVGLRMATNGCGSIVNVGSELSSIGMGSTSPIARRSSGSSA